MYRYPLEEILPALTIAMERAPRDLRLPRYRNNPNPQAGLCYSASEAAFHLGAAALGYRPLNTPWEGTSHWCLERTILHPDRPMETLICDPTVSQFIHVPDYALGRRRGFLTGYRRPSWRARVLMDAALRELHTYSLPDIDAPPLAVV